MSDATTAHQPENVPTSPATRALREKLLDGLAAVSEFAEAVHRSDRTVFNWIAQGMPTSYVGRTPYVVVDPARDWLLSRRGRKFTCGPGSPQKVTSIPSVRRRGPALQLAE
jgi:hypothetical protein